MDRYATVFANKRRALILLNILLLREENETLAKNQFPNYAYFKDDVVIEYEMLQMRKGIH